MPNNHVLRLYTSLLTAIGAVTMVAVLVQSARQSWSPDSTQVISSLLLAVMTVIAGTLIVKVRSEDGDEDRISTVSAYAVGLLVIGPLALAVVAQIVSLVIEQVRTPRPVRKFVFNVAQYVLTIVAARLVYVGVSGHIEHLYDFTTVVGGIDLLAGVLAGITYFAINYLLVTTAICLATGISPRQMLLNSLRLHMFMTFALGCLGPIIAVLMQIHPLAIVLAIMQPLIVQYTIKLASKHQHRSYHDPLTGLPNRAYFGRRLSAILKESSGEQVATMMLDLDHFKDINDTLGHTAGDDLLRVVASRLRESAAGSAEIFRLGGDEFAILIPAGSELDSEQVARHLLDGLKDPITADGLDITVHASIGIAFYPQHAQDGSGLMRCADVALYKAKESRDDVQIYCSDSDSTDRMSLTLATDLHQAVQAGELLTYFQPQVDAATQEVVGFEALTRWIHPEYGFVPPDRFIAIAESTGLIGQMSQDMIGDSLLMASELEDQSLTVSVNLSARLLVNTSMSEWIMAELARTGVKSERLVVEVTESTFITDPQRAIETLAILRDQGVQISIDDFGTGYSSMKNLADLQPDELKIDKAFVMGMSKKANEVIVRTTISMGQSLGVRVVAEGIEDSETAELLHRLGCSDLQGYHFARPMPKGDLLGWLAKRKVTQMEQRRLLTVF